MALKDTYIAKLTPGTKSTISNQYFDLNHPFAPPRQGNECTAYICGRDYMKAVADSIRTAKRFIFIADWQLDFDVELDQRKSRDHPGRLSELLADAAKRGVHVRILCYDSMNTLNSAATALGQEGPPDTHEELSAKTLAKLSFENGGSIITMLQNPNTTNSAFYLSKTPNVAFSHHQKFLVIDGNVAFLGGIDLAYGRWDTPDFNIAIDPSVHILNDAYNGQINPARYPSIDELALTQPVAGRPGFARPLRTNNHKVLDPKTQPRMPWNDVAAKISGPSAYDVFVNFVLRWNSFARAKTNIFDASLSVRWFEESIRGHETLIDPLIQGNGSTGTQICRSASSAQLEDEVKLWSLDRKYIHDDWKQPNLSRRKAMLAAREEWAKDHQTSIHDAMVQCIRAAQAFIYIENQFFISNCGLDIHDTPSPARNNIVTELGNAIAKAIFAERPFHIWLVLPEQPEGKILSQSVKSQAWWALQGIKHGSESLIKQINQALFAKHKKKWQTHFDTRSQPDIFETLKSQGMEEEWRNYLTVLNLRNYGETKSSLLSEMVYVHSKLLIVDDAVAIIGSANINDRSLLGNGDTELAAVFVDTKDTMMTNIGQDIKCITRKFAKDLRISIWKKYLGTSISKQTRETSKADQLLTNICIEQPLNSASIKGIFQISQINRLAYNQVFQHTPRNNYKFFEDTVQCFPRLIKKVKTYSIDGISIGEFNANGIRRDPYVIQEVTTDQPDFSRTPQLQTRYMKGKEHDVEAGLQYLRSTVRGFFVEMPLDWGIGEKVTPPAPRNSPIMIASDPTNNQESANT